MCIVIVKGNDGTMYYYGPFSSVDEATSWAFNNCSGFEWHWVNLIQVMVDKE